MHKHRGKIGIRHVCERRCDRAPYARLHRRNQPERGRRLALAALLHQLASTFRVTCKRRCDYVSCPSKSVRVLFTWRVTLNRQNSLGAKTWQNVPLQELAKLTTTADD